jgi:hypothetical protein
MIYLVKPTLDATPIDCLWIVREPSVTVSVNSSPEEGFNEYISSICRYAYPRRMLFHISPPRENLNDTPQGGYEYIPRHFQCLH